MSPGISNILYLVIELPGNVWRIRKSFFENSLRKWWHSHY